MDARGDDYRNSISAVDFQQDYPQLHPLPAPALPSQLHEIKQECTLLRAQVRHLQTRLDEAGLSGSAELVQLRAAYEGEQQAHSNVLSQLAAERQNLAVLQQERQSWKQRMREAKAAYDDLKKVLLRERAQRAAHVNSKEANDTGTGSIAKIADRQPDPVPVAQNNSEVNNAVDDATQEIPETAVHDRLIDAHSPSPTQLPTSDDIRYSGGGTVTILTQTKPSPRQALVQNIQAGRRLPDAVLEEEQEVVATAAVPEDPARRRPQPGAWKRKARAADGMDDFEFSDFDVSARIQSRQRQQPHPTTGDAERMPPPQSRTKSLQRKRPNDADGQNYAYQAVIRRKEDRDQLSAFECEDCRRFYDAVERWGGVNATTDLPRCDHRQNGASAAEGIIAARQTMVAQGSRHRYLYAPPPTPEGYWDILFSPQPPRGS
jgi:hypothetical protein